MKIKHIFSFAVLAVMTAACSSEDIIQQPTFQSGQTLPFRATISAYAGTRGLTEATDGLSITAKWVVGEKIALVHGKTVDVMEVKTVDNTTGNATIDGTVTSFNNGDPVYLVYVGCQSGAMDDFKTGLLETFTIANTADASVTAITEDMIKENFKIIAQDGTLTFINNGLDFRLGTSTLTKISPTNSAEYVTFGTDKPTLSSQFAIWKLKLTTDGTTAIAATNLGVKDADNNEFITEIQPSASASEFYVMLPAPVLPATAVNYTFEATVDNEVGIYTVTHSDVSLTAGKFYQSTLTMAKTVNLARLEAAYVAQDGDVLTGELDVTNHPVKISIADGATVTLNGVTINGVNNSSYSWAGITCEGDATIILADGSTNTVKGFYSIYPGIFVPGDYDNPSNNKTLTIKGGTTGTGSLITSPYDGGSYLSFGAGIGGGLEISCGNIVIQGGNITARGGSAAGIGGGTVNSGVASCGNITISGGTINAFGGDHAAGIGCAYNDHGIIACCGDITISGGIITATGGMCGAGIGSGTKGYCHNINISGGTIMATGGDHATGIGSGGNPNSTSYCGNVTISGGTVEASGGRFGAAGIGSGNRASCGDITITTSVTKVKATKGGDYSIGRGNDGSCGTVTIGGTLDGDGNPVGGTVCWQNNAAVGDGGTYLSTSPCVYCPPVALTAVTSANLGWIIGSDGKAYMSAVLLPAGTTAVAMITYVGSATGETSFTHGLALAMSDANGGSACQWKTETTDAGHIKPTSSSFESESGLQYNNETHNSDTYPAFKYAMANNGTAAPTDCSAWFLPTGYQWNQMINACKNVLGTKNSYEDLRDGFNGVGGTNLRSNSPYWSSTEYGSDKAWDYFYNGSWSKDWKTVELYVRSALAF